MKCLAPVKLGHARLFLPQKFSRFQHCYHYVYVDLLGDEHMLTFQIFMKLKSQRINVEEPSMNAKIKG